MFSGRVGSTFLGSILFISASLKGVLGQADSFCALKGSSVDLPCSAKQPTTNRKWYTVSINGYRPLDKLPAEGNHLTTNMSEEKIFALTINDLKESDSNDYCCQKNPGEFELCWDDRIQLHVTDLQVKVIPTKEGNTVTLMCSTSCALTETPAAYIWYKNGDFLYEDWSPWYQQLVSGDKAVTYSCAIKGYEDLKAPEVSVDAVTSTCFNLTYAGGRMCSDWLTSVDNRCSITFPTEVHIQRTPLKDLTLTCHSSCPLIDSQTTYTWYEGGNLNQDTVSQQRLFNHTFDKELTCALKTNKDLLSAGVCLDDNNCWRVNYANRTICAPQGSTINISAEYQYPEKQQPKKTWYKIMTNSDDSAEKLTGAAGRVEYHHLKNQSILRIMNLKRHDSAEYVFSLQRDGEGWGKPDLRGVMVIATGLEVKFTPSAVVTEGQSVTLTCSTSCPLTDDTNYIWNFNSLTLPESTDKQLVLDPVSSQHAGNYSCAVKTRNISSQGKTLAVHSKTEKWILAAAAGTSAALLVVIPLVVLWLVRTKRTSSQPPPTTKTSQNMQQLNHVPVNDTISAQPTEEDDLHYSRVHFSNNQVDPLYSTVQPHQPLKQEHVHYAVVTSHKAQT